MDYINRHGLDNYVPRADDKFDARLISWFGSVKFDVLHVDSQGHSATYTVWLPDANELIIARVFSLGDNVEISIDKEFIFYE